MTPNSEKSHFEFRIWWTITAFCEVPSVSMTRKREVRTAKKSKRRKYIVWNESNQGMLLRKAMRRIRSRVYGNSANYRLADTQLSYICQTQIVYQQITKILEAMQMEKLSNANCRVLALFLYLVCFVHYRILWNHVCASDQISVLTQEAVCQT